MSARRLVHTCAEDKRQHEKIPKRRETPLPKSFLSRANPVALVRMTSDSRAFQTQSLLAGLPLSLYLTRLRGRLLARRIRSSLLHTFTRFLEFPQHKKILAFVFAHFSFNSSQSPIIQQREKELSCNQSLDHQPLFGFCPPTLP